MKNDDIVREIKRNLPSIENLVNMKDGEKRGNEIQGTHPIHGSDTEMNLILHTDSQTFHCFRHNVSGDRLSWIAIDEGLVTCKNADDIHDVFPQILEKAAEIAGVDIDQEYDEEELKERKKTRQILKRGFKKAQEYFKSNLNEDVKEWIKEKYGFDEEIIEEHDIGYAPKEKKGLRKKLENEIGEHAFCTGLIQKYGDDYRDFFRGRVVFPYKVSGEPVYFIARETPWTPEDNFKGNKYLKQLVGPRKEYVDELVTNPLWGKDSIRGEREMIVTEGVTDAITAQVWDYPVVSPVTVKFQNEDINKVKKMVRNREVYICNDADEGGFTGALDMLEKIDDSYMVELPEGYDLNEFYQDYSKSDFEELKENALPRCEALARYHEDERYCLLPGLEEIAQDPNKVRQKYNPKNQEYEFYSMWDILEGIKDFEECLPNVRRSEKSHPRSFNALDNSSRLRLISASIIRHLSRKGKFIYDTDEKDVYYFDEEEHEVWTVEGEDFKTRLYKRYRVSKDSEESDTLLNDMKSYARGYGSEVEVHRSWHFDKENYILYIHNRDKYYYELDGKKIDKHPNGHKGIFFSHRDEDNYITYLDEDEREYPEKVYGQMDKWEDEGNFLHKVMVNRTNFENKYALSDRQQRLQHLVNLYIYPFDDAYSTKPISSWVGEKGSGKTLTMRWLGKFLMGDEFEVTTLPDSKRDFTAVAHNLPVFFIDNMDKSKGWVNDILATVATGGKVQERELYTNMKMKEGKIDSWLGINARDPKFKRDDIVDRLLIFYVQRIEDNIDPKILTKTVLDYQDTLWSEYMDDLNEIINIWKSIDEREMSSPHRIVGWVVFARIVRKALDLDKDMVNEMIRNIHLEKAAFSVADDPAFTALKKYKKEHYAVDWHPASFIDKKLRELHDEYDESYESSMSLAKRLPHVRSELEKLIGMEMREDRGENRKEYRFVDKAIDEINGDAEDEPQKDITTIDQPLKNQIFELLTEDERTIDEFFIKIENYSEDEIRDELDRLIEDGGVRKEKEKLGNMDVYCLEEK